MNSPEVVNIVSAWTLIASDSLRIVPAESLDCKEKVFESEIPFIHQVTLSSIAKCCVLI